MVYRPSRIAFPRRLLNDSAGAFGDIAMAELSPEPVREKCHQYLVLGLRLIRPEERVTAIAAALKEVETREQRLAAIVRQ